MSQTRSALRGFQYTTVSPVPEVCTHRHPYAQWRAVDAHITGRSLQISQSTSDSQTSLKLAILLMANFNFDSNNRIKTKANCLPWLGADFIFHIVMLYSWYLYIQLRCRLGKTKSQIRIACLRLFRRQTYFDRFAKVIDYTSIETTSVNKKIIMKALKIQSCTHGSPYKYLARIVNTSNKRLFFLNNTELCIKLVSTSW